MMKISQTHNDAIHLAFDPTKLELLISEGKLHVADFICLDKTSKQSVWSMVRATATRAMRLS